MLYFNLRPLSFLKTCRGKEETRYLVRQNAQPDTNNAESKYIAAQIGAGGTDESDADGGSNCCIKCVPCTTQTAHIYDLADLKSDDKDNDPHDAHADGDDMFLHKEKAHERFGAEEIYDRETYGNDAAEHPAYASVFFGKLLVSGAEAASDQRYCRGLKPVSEGERKSHDIHAHLMGCHCVGSLFGGHDRRHHETDAHQNLFEENAVSDFDKVEKTLCGRKNFIFHNIRKADESIGFQDG